MKKISVTVIFMTFLLGFLASSCREVPTSNPNIILFLVDDMGWQDTSVPFWEEETPINRNFHTPNMERMARQGMKFTSAYSCPVCSPTRVSLMTGMNAASHRVTNWTLRKNASNDGRNDKLDAPQWNVNGMSPETVTERGSLPTSGTLTSALASNNILTPSGQSFFCLSNFCNGVSL